MIDACKVPEGYAVTSRGHMHYPIPDGYFVSKYDSELFLVYYRHPNKLSLSDRVARIFRGCGGVWEGYLDRGVGDLRTHELFTRNPDLNTVILAICTAHRVGING